MRIDLKRVKNLIVRFMVCMGEHKVHVCIDVMLMIFGEEDARRQKGEKSGREKNMPLLLSYCCHIILTFSAAALLEQVQKCTLAGPLLLHDMLILGEAGETRIFGCVGVCDEDFAWRRTGEAGRRREGACLTACDL